MKPETHGHPDHLDPSDNPDAPARDASLRVAPVCRGRRRVLLGLVGVICLALGATLIVRHIQARVPDPSTADPSQLIGFLMSERFNELTDAERRAFAEAMVRRYAEMTDEQRKLAEAEMKAFNKENPELVREQTIRFWKDYAVSEAEQYVEVPPDQREAYLEAKVAGWRMVFGWGDEDKNRQKRRQDREDQDWEERLSPENQQKAAEFYTNQVLPRTSARDRALTAVMMRDLGRMMRQP